jgi:hypothetical protein
MIVADHNKAWVQCTSRLVSNKGSTNVAQHALDEAGEGDGCNAQKTSRDIIAY